MVVGVSFDMEGESECSLVGGGGSMDIFNEFVGVRFDDGVWWFDDGSSINGWVDGNTNSDGGDDCGSVYDGNTGRDDCDDG